MDLISVDRAADVRSRTAESLIKAFGSVIWVDNGATLGLNDVRPGRANRSVLQMRGSLEDDANRVSASVSS